MAARIRKQHTDEIRAKIQVSQLVNVLTDQALGKLIKNPEQAPNKRALTEDQVRFWDEWKGTPMAIVETEDDALRFARALTFGE